MIKLLFVLAVGVAIGYGYGFKDAKTHKTNVFDRTAVQLGISFRESYANDVDGQLTNVNR